MQRLENNHYDYEIDRFSENAMLALEAGICLAGEMGHTYIGTEHYLLGLLHQQPNHAAEILQHFEITEQRFSQQLLQTIGQRKPHCPGYSSMTPALHRLFSEAQNLADASGINEIGTRFLLLAMLRDENNAATELLEFMQADIEAMKQTCRAVKSFQNALQCTYSFGVSPAVPVRKTDAPFRTG